MEKLSFDVGIKIEWSEWSRCESSFSLLLVPHRPGVFALAEEVLGANGSSRRMLALLSAAEAADLAYAMSGLFAPASPQRERLERSRCYVRYAVIPDAVERQTVRFALQAWMNANAERATGIEAASPVAEENSVDCDPADCTRSLAAGAGAKTVSNRALARPAFPAGF